MQSLSEASLNFVAVGCVSVYVALLSSGCDASILGQIVFSSRQRRG